MLDRSAGAAEMFCHSSTFIDFWQMTRFLRLTDEERERERERERKDADTVK